MGKYHYILQKLTVGAHKIIILVFKYIIHYNLSLLFYRNK